MGKTEKQKLNKGFRFRMLVLLLCLTVLLAAGYGLYCLIKTERKPVTEVEKTKGGSLAECMPEDITAISVQLRSGEKWRLVMQDGHLSPEGKNGWTMDSHIEEDLLDIAANIGYEDILTDEAIDYENRLEEFGLDQPLTEAVFEYNDGSILHVMIGDENPMADDYSHYMLVEGKTGLYTVSKGNVQTLLTEQALFHPVEQPEIRNTAIDRITIRDGEGNIKAEWVCRQSSQDSTGSGQWNIDIPFVYPADSAMMASLLENAGKMYLGIYVGEATQENLEQCGLVRPVGSIEFHMTAGPYGDIGEDGTYEVVEKPEGSVLFTIGQEKNEMTDYVLFENAIYTMNQFQLGVFLDADPMETASRYPVMMTWDELAYLSVEEAADRIEYVIVKEKEYTEQGTEMLDDDNQPVYTGTVMRNGEEIQMDAFRAAYERLRVVTVSGRLGEEAGYEAETYKKYTFRNEDGETYIVELSEYDTYHDMVTMNGNALFYMQRGSMIELP